MFIQKLNIDPKKSYSTTTTIENLIENLFLICNHVPVITPYASKSQSNDQIFEELNKEKSYATMTVPQYLEFKDNFDSSHIVIENADLLESFGYKIEDLDKPVIINEGSNTFEKLPLCRFFIKAEDSDKFVALFILSKIFDIAVITKDTDKMKIFCKVFRLDCKIYDLNEDISKIDQEGVILFDCFKDIRAERIFFIGKKSYKTPQLDLDLKEAGKFKYRIHNVVGEFNSYSYKRYGKFDFDRYANIHK